MNINFSQMYTANIASLKQAINMANLSRAMNQDAQSMDNLVKAMEQSVTPHKGGNLDLKL